MQFGLTLVGIAILLSLGLCLVAEVSLRRRSTDFHVSSLAEPPTHVDLIIVLGAGTRPDRPVLGDRILCAEQAAKVWPMAKILLSGNDLSSGETIAMKEALQSRDQLNETRLFQDGQAMSTRQSFKNLRTNFSGELTVIVCTNEFHQRRSVALAREYGFRAWAFGKDQTTYDSRFWLFLRERVSTIKWIFEANGLVRPH